MLEPNWLVVLASSLIPMILGMIWYNPNVFGSIWMKESGMTEEKIKGSNMFLIMGLAWFFGLLISVSMLVWTVHQMHIGSLFQGQEAELANPNSELSIYVNDFMAKYGKNFRTFKHGAFHGILGSIFLALPIIGTNALFEKKSFKYIAIHVGYWMINMAIIGGVICQWV